jgi:3-mercaptopyruvate sulfurtransferase SseA
MLQNYKIHSSDYLQATSQTPYQHKQASCPSSGKKKTNKKTEKKKEDFTFSADDEPSWRGGLSGGSGRRWSVRTLFVSDELGSARTNYSGTWNRRNKMQI